MTHYREGRIIILEGAQRSGKTLAASLFAHNACRLGKTVWSNIAFTFPFKPIDFYAMTLENDVRPLRNGFIFLDELNFLLDARTSGSPYNRDFAKFLLQVKKQGITLVGTTHLIDYVDRRFRENYDFLIKTQVAPRIRPDDVPPEVLRMHVLNGPNQSVGEKHMMLKLSPPMLGLYDTAHTFNPFANMPPKKRKTKAKGSTSTRKNAGVGVIAQ